MAVGKPQGLQKPNRAHWFGKHIYIAVVQAAQAPLGPVTDGSEIRYGGTLEDYRGTIRAEDPGDAGYSQEVDSTYGLVLDKATSAPVGGIAFGELDNGLALGTGDFTIIGRVMQTGGPDFNALMGKGDAAADQWMLNVAVSVSGTRRICRWYGGSTAIAVTPTEVAVNDVWYDICATRIAGTTYVYGRTADGGTIRTDSGADANNYDGADHFLFLFGADYAGGEFDSSRDFQGKIDYLYYALGRGLEQPEVEAIWDDPFAVYTEPSVGGNSLEKEWIISNDESGEAFVAPFGYHLESVQFSGTYGSGTLLLEGSNETTPTTWAELVSEAALGIYTPAGQMHNYRPRVAGGTGSTITVTAYFERN